MVVAAGLVLGGRYWTRGENFSGLQGDVSFLQRLATSRVRAGHVRRSPAAGRLAGLLAYVAWPLYAPDDLYTRGALVTHNTVIQALGETGILGFIPFTLLVGVAIYHARKLALDAVRPGLANLGEGIGISLCGFVVCGMSGDYVLTWFPYILLGLAAAAREIGRQTE